MRSISVTDRFASTHRDAAHGPHIHGHTYVVTAHELGNDAGVHREIQDDLKAILDELDMHNLDEMLIGGAQTADGIAAWIMERLLTRHPRLVKVDLVIADEPDVMVSVTREIRV